MRLDAFRTTAALVVAASVVVTAPAASTANRPTPVERVAAAVTRPAVSAVPEASPARPARTSTPVPGVDYGYGSGAIGDWSGLTRSRSSAAQFQSAPVWQYGDSIARADGPDLAQRLYDTAGVTLAVDNWNGRPTGPAVDQLIADLAAYGAPDVLIMATGTNDIFNPPGFAAEVERVMAAVPDGTDVVWVNVYAARWALGYAGRESDQRNAAWIDMQVATADGIHGDDLTVVKWFEALAGNPGYRLSNWLSDGVHTTSMGRAARNGMIVATVTPLL